MRTQEHPFLEVEMRLLPHGRTAKLVARLAVLLTVVFGGTAVVASPAFAGIASEFQIGDNYQYVKFYWTWDSNRRITDVAMSLLDDECNGQAAVGSFTVHRYGGLSNTSVRYNSRGCGQWQVFPMGSFSYGEDIINIEVCTFQWFCGGYIDNPFT
jgi:hypothetical protein